MQDMCEQVRSSQSHNVHRIVHFDAFAPAALFVRIALSFILGRSPRTPLAAAMWLAVWLALLTAKVALGYWLKSVAAAYLRHYERRHAKGSRLAARVCRTSFADGKSRRD